MIQNPELLRGLQNAPVQYFPMNTEPQYINQAITMPTEKIPTVDEMNQNYTGAKYQIFKNNFPTPSPREFDMQTRLYGLKTEYKGLQEKIDALDATKDADKIKTLRQGQKDLSDSANVLRNVASGMGYDINGFGANNTFDEATQRIFLNRERGMAEFADMPSTATQKREVYRQARRAGISPNEARAVAESYHDEFREKNINRLVEGIGAYGMNADGSLNQFGQMMMGKLYNESPYAYGNIANGFANPKDVFNVNANLVQATMNNDAAMQQKLASLQSARDIAKLNLDDKKEARAQTEQHHQDDMQYKWTKMDLDNQFKLLSEINGTPQAKMEQEIKAIADTFFGGDMEKAAKVYAEKHYQNSFGTKKDNADKDKILKYIQFRTGYIEHCINNGDFQGAKERINEWRQAMQSEDFKHSEQLDKEDTMYLLHVLDVYEQVANNQMTPEEFAKVKRQLDGKTYADDIAENPYSSTDYGQSQIMNRHRAK